MNAVLSVVIPTRGKADRLALTLACLRTQTVAAEVVVVDDAGGDPSTAAVVAGSGLPARLVPGRGTGRAAARNTGAAAATGPTLLFLDDDILTGPGFLAAHVQAGDATPIGPSTVDRVVHGVLEELPLARRLVQERPGAPHEAVAGGQFGRTFANALERMVREMAEGTTPPVAPWLACVGGNVSMPRGLWERSGGFDESFGTVWGCEDLEFGYRLAASGAAMCVATGAAGIHLTHVRPGRWDEHVVNLTRFLALHPDPAVAALPGLLSANGSPRRYLDLLTRQPAPDDAGHPGKGHRSGTGVQHRSKGDVMTLAIDGGTPVRDRPFPTWPQYDDTERDGLLRALEQGPWWRVGGSEVTTFEQEFAAFHGAPAGLAVGNGTQALELALEIYGVGPGDEVIVPAFTFISTSNAVQRLGAVPVPVDVDPVTYCLDPAALEAARTARTRMVIPVHMAGQVADVDAIDAWAAGHGIVVVQDAAHAHGAVWRGRRIGELGSVACFSFQNGKLMTAGEGGAVLFADAAMYPDAFARHSCGRPIGDTRYEHLTPSSNFRMPEFSGAVLRAQLTRLAGQNQHRESRWKVMSAELDEIPGVQSQGRDPRCELNPHYMAMFTIDPAARPGVARDEVVRALNAEGVPAFVNYPPVYRTRAFQNGPTGNLPSPEALAEQCPRTEFLADHGVWLHHKTLLGGEAEVADVRDAVRKVLDGLRP
jgi:3-amino-5-hydroxybenzoate synthase